jgi:hypothetical protein
VHFTPPAGITLYDLPFEPGDPDQETGDPLLLLGEGGRMYASYGKQVAALDYASGTVIWTYTSPTYRLQLEAVQEDHEIVVKAIDSGGNESLMRIDAGGNAVMGSLTGKDVQHYWENNWLNINPLSMSFEVVKDVVIRYPGSAWMDPTQWGTNRAPTHGLLVVSDYSRDPPEQTAIADVLGKIKTALALPANAGCKAWMDGGPLGDAAAYIQILLNVDTFGHGSFVTATIAFVGIDGVLGIPASSSITVNRDSMYFHAKDAAGMTFKFLGGKTYPGATLPARAAILIHEFGHLMSLPGFLPDHIRGNPKQSTQNGKSNDKLVDTHCGGLIGALK